MIRSICASYTANTLLIWYNYTKIVITSNENNFACFTCHVAANLIFIPNTISNIICIS
jgi:hypothetical protein